MYVGLWLAASWKTKKEVLNIAYGDGMWRCELEWTASESHLLVNYGIRDLEQ
jgi:hypothetical protein